MKFTIKNEDIAYYNDVEAYSFPKYTSQLMNWANQNAQGTRPAVVGEVTELLPEFLSSGENKTLDSWRSWYMQRHPEAIQKATEKIWDQLNHLRDAMQLIDRDMVEKWVDDLVINKTFNGLCVQKAILSALAEKLNTSYRPSTS